MELKKVLKSITKFELDHINKVYIIPIYFKIIKIIKQLFNKQIIKYIKENLHLLLYSSILKGFICKKYNYYIFEIASDKFINL